MTIDWTFPRRLAAVVVAAAALAAFPLAHFGSAEVLASVLLGAALSAANALAGYLMIEYTFKKPYSTFLKAVLGGMGLRLLGLLGAMTVAVVVLHLPLVPFTASLFGFYTISLILEILHLQRKVAARNQE
jgi:hypothetical protein